MSSAPADLLATDRIPAHVGIIMDGNGRWAIRAGKPRRVGHEEGLVAAKRVVKAAREIGIKYLSLYTFSTENWRRAEEEVKHLMGLLATRLRTEYDFYRENRVRVVHSGDLKRLPEQVSREIVNVVRDTADFDGITVNLAINYGGRDEIIRSVNRWLSNGRERDELVTEELIRSHLDLPEFPEPDLVIRTAGERRVSNFLLWECAYSELHFSEVLWPDFDKSHLVAALVDFQNRSRKFGGND